MRRRFGVPRREVPELKGHEGRIRSVACSPDGTKILTGGDDTTARIWNAAGGTLLTVLNGHKNHVQSVAFSPDGSSVATGSDDNSARIWGRTARKSPHAERPPGSVPSVAFSPDGKAITGSADGTARSDPRRQRLAGSVMGRQPPTAFQSPAARSFCLNQMKQRDRRKSTAGRRLPGAAGGRQRPEGA